MFVYPILPYYNKPFPYQPYPLLPFMYLKPDPVCFGIPVSQFL